MDKPARHSLRDMIPHHWLERYDHAWLTAYSIALGTESEFKAAKRVELSDALILGFWGSLTYLDASTVSLRFSPTGELIAAGGITHRDTDEGAWLAIVQPCSTNSPKNEYALKVNASALASLLISVTTRNYAYERVFDNCVSLLADETTAASSPVLGPHGYDRPLRSALDTFKNAAHLIEQLPDADRRRVRLSLHWYDKSLRSYGVDSYLSNWIAIETLAMPDTSNVRPINARLATLYNLSLSEVAERFGVGRLLGLRSRIVHDGEDLTVYAHLSDYANRLYEDLLHDTLGMRANRLGEVALEKSFSMRLC